MDGEERVKYIYEKSIGFKKVIIEKNRMEEVEQKKIKKMREKREKRHRIK